MVNLSFWRGAEDDRGGEPKLPLGIRKAMDLAGRIEVGSLEMVLPDGRRFEFRGAMPGPEAKLIIKDQAFARRLAEGDIGVAESYLAGEWESPDVAKFLEVFAANQPVLERLLKDRPALRFMQMISHWRNRNTRAGSKRNIHAHYDLGNAFYKEWLDPSMTYSSALGVAEDGDLAAAQRRKNAALVESLQIEPSHHVLEIGCGWGGFAEFVAKTVGAQVTALTISKAQYDFARERIFNAGLADKVTVEMRDYRDEHGAYDRIASIEMFEAVGEEYWQAYFGQLWACLKSGGRAGVQVITIREDIFPRYRRELDFIRRFIFPGGMLPTPTILRQLAEKHGLNVDAVRAFGLDYALTLATWRDRFQSAWDRIAPLGFDERFRRLWSYYLSYCEAGFRAGSIDVQQMVMAKP
ncbi:MAG: cyclopropane-fatty-acyl-phospholipid synthase [Ancalomicrobiaceae bacterium]|nr:cyclopropane-fatty-acyl-phospholipid synthase [Ancalomicrobiaceae bacterium]